MFQMQQFNAFIAMFRNRFWRRMKRWYRSRTHTRTHMPASQVNWVFRHGTALQLFIKIQSYSACVLLEQRVQFAKIYRDTYAMDKWWMLDSFK